MSPPLRGRVALVTGSSRGIGRAIALALAGAGADLVLTSTKEGGAEETANAVRQHGQRALAVACDVVLPGSVERLLDRAHQQFQRVDVLVNNAGVVLRAALAQTSDEEFERVLGVNLRGPFHLARRLVPGMKSSPQSCMAAVSWQWRFFLGAWTPRCFRGPISTR